MTRKFIYWVSTVSQDLCNKYSKVFSWIPWISTAVSSNLDEHGNKNVKNNYRQHISFVSESQFSVTSMRPFMEDVKAFGRFMLSLF